MRSLFKKADIKTKAKLSAACGAALLIWTIFTLADPMTSFAMFGDSIAGSNILLIIISLVVTIPLVLLFTKLTGRDIPLLACVLSGLVCHICFIYIYSIFGRDIYEKDWRFLMILPVAAAVISGVLIFIKGADDKKRLAVYGAVYSVLSVGEYFLLFSLALSAMLR
ncbi:MAG: hypothetical protein ILP19_05000 [Oscillospiraceae bacterium]|nr:hypothetical protein [Oscillospiraceae bacterium]